jgi:hypothetical protein
MFLKIIYRRQRFRRNDRHVEVDDEARRHHRKRRSSLGRRKSGRRSLSRYHLSSFIVVYRRLSSLIVFYRRLTSFIVVIVVYHKENLSKLLHKHYSQ